MAHIDEAPQPAGTTERGSAPPRGREKKLGARDRFTVIMMVTVPLLLVLGLVWVPALLSVVLSFGKWNGFGDLDTIEWVGVQNYHDIVTIYPAFWPAIQHNLIWLVFLFLVPTVLGMLIAVLLDREVRGSRFYQTAFYMPVVLSWPSSASSGSCSTPATRG